jgi:TATA-binding protein-associated factor
MLYEDFSHSNVKEEVKGELSDSASGKKGQHIFQALQYLRKLCNHPAFVVTPEHPKHSQVMTLLKKQGKSLDDVENSPKLMALQ